MSHDIVALLWRTMCALNHFKMQCYVMQSISSQVILLLWLSSWFSPWTDPVFTWWSPLSPYTPVWAATFLNKCEDTHFVHFGVTVLAWAQTRVLESAQPREHDKDMYYVTWSLLKCLQMNNVKYCVCLHDPKCLHCLFVNTCDICDFNRGCVCSPAGRRFPSKHAGPMDIVLVVFFVHLTSLPSAHFQCVLLPLCFSL